MLWSTANLDEYKLKAIKSLEERLRKPVLAFSSLDVDPDNLNEDELIRIKELEDELGVALVAIHK